MKLKNPFSKKGELKPRFEVGCAVVRHNGKILIARRKHETHMGGLWEFPGGKRLGGESLASCLAREALEEVGIRVQPGRFLAAVNWSYREKDVSLYFYECELIGGILAAKDCLEFRWVWPFELGKYEFPPANGPMVAFLSRMQR